MNLTNVHYKLTFKLKAQTKSISTGAQYVTLDNKIKCLSLSFFFWATQPIRLELELHICGNYSKSLGRIIMIDQSKILSRSQVQFITLFLRGSQLCCTFYQPLQATLIWCNKTNFLSLTGTFWNFRNKFYFLESHIEHRWRCSKSKHIQVSQLFLIIFKIFKHPSKLNNIDANPIMD
jgi:hypothetical protein